MSSISLPLARQSHPEPARIAALSAAIALNLAVLLIAAQPLPASFPAMQQLVPAALVRLIPPPALPAPPPPVELKPLPHAPTVSPMLPHPTPVSAPPTPIAEGTLAAPTVDIAPTPPAVGSAPTVGAAPIEASLAYQANPLTYPATALRQHLQGTVVLRVLVDETGKPLEVSVLHGSGYTVLDRSAREQVLSRWRFQPAFVNGHAVRAWASVPVTFALRG